MVSLIWSFFLFCCTYLIDGGTASIVEEMYDKNVLRKNISIRLIRRDWKPQGPSASTDEVMEEYMWSVAEAFNALKGSKWEFQKAPIKDSMSLFSSADYNPDQDSIVVLHPIFSSADVGFIRSTINALTMRNLHKKYNLFAVDMPLNNPQMTMTILRTIFGLTPFFAPMAEAASEFLVMGIKGGRLRPEQIHLIGWSYSAQLVGYMGRYIKSVNGKKIGSIVSLDPYSSALNRNLIDVSRNDANVVHIYHSNSAMAGTPKRVGTADFVFNDGNLQPECLWPHVMKTSVKESMICSHLKVVQRFWYIILYPSKFIGVKCESYNHLMNCYCTTNERVGLSYPITTESEAKGTYFLRTLATKPYGMERWGVTCSPGGLNPWTTFVNDDGSETQYVKNESIVK